MAFKRCSGSLAALIPCSAASVWRCGKRSCVFSSLRRLKSAPSPPFPPLLPGRNRHPLTQLWVMAFHEPRLHRASQNSRHPRSDATHQCIMAMTAPGASMQFQQKHENIHTAVTTFLPIAAAVFCFTQHAAIANQTNLPAPVNQIKTARNKQRAAAESIADCATSSDPFPGWCAG